MKPALWTPLLFILGYIRIRLPFSHNWRLSFCLLEIRMFNKQIKLTNSANLLKQHTGKRMSASVFYKWKICVCFQCCMGNLVSFQIFSWDEVTLVIVYLFCSLEHKLPNLSSSIYHLETNGEGGAAGGASIGQGTIMSALLGHWGIFAALVLLCGCIRRLTVWRSYVVCSIFGNRWVAAK